MFTVVMQSNVGSSSIFKYIYILSIQNNNNQG
uniref:Uncharacterized protein n=1 Tax=Arundo donax TaxID=35708 RepID=A0A0A8ZYR5_ARUDO